MEARIYVDGRITPPQEAVIPVLDRGFLYGDSVYETIWWHRGVLVQRGDHLARLRESARRLWMEIPFADADLSEAVRRTCEAARVGPAEDASVRLVVTRGVGPLGLAVREGVRPTLVVMVSPADRPDRARFERGFTVAVVRRREDPSRPHDPQAKSGNYVHSLLALHEARQRGADDAIVLAESGEVAESTIANVFAVRRGRLGTPPLAAGILKGTCRTRILALAAREGVPAGEERLLPQDLQAAEEVFLSSSVKGIRPVVAIDGAPVGSGGPGPLTRRVRDWLEREADAEAAAEAAASGPGGAARGVPDPGGAAS